MRKIPYILLALFILTIYPYNNAFAQTESVYHIEALNNPYPGYLYFDVVYSPGFKKFDNYSNFIEYDDVSKDSPYFKVLRNGNIAQIAGNHYYIYDKDMNLLDSILNPSEYNLDMHDFTQLRNGNYLLLLNGYVDKDMSEIVEGGRSDARIIDNYLIETSGRGDIIWEWSALEHYDIRDATEDIDLTQVSIDFAHINTLDEDKNGNILVSVRHYDEISLIDKSSGDFIWRMGGLKCKNNQFTFIDDNTDGYFGFSHQHTTEFLDNGNLLIFDNGNLKSPRYSRAVEYSVDLANMTVTNVWEYRSSPDLYSQAMGSAFRLPNGNTLISWSFDQITEVKPDKSVALRITAESPFPTYRAFKVFSNTNFVKHKLVDFKEYDFKNTEYETGVKIDVESAIMSNVNLYVQKHNYAPSSGQFDDSIFTSVLPYRWVLSTDYDSFDLLGKIKFNLFDINGFDNPSKLVIYKRDKEANGIFRKLETEYNQSKNEISANFDSFGEFVVVNASLSAPKLISPENDAYTKHSDKLFWEKTVGAKYYNIQISQNMQFTEPIIANYDTDTLFVEYFDLEYNTNYYWRVRAYNEIDTSSWSEVYTFITEIASPLLITPENGFIGVKLDSKMIWSKVEEADKYQIQVSQFYNFNISILLDTVTQKNEYSFFDLSYNTTYYLRFKAIRGSDTSSWSEVFEFTTILQTPILSLPANSEINVPKEYIFRWSYIPEAKYYQIQFSDKNNFSNKIIDKSLIEDNEYLVSELKSNTRYYWRVRAMRETDTSAWSEVFQFTTILKIPILEYPKNMQNSVEVNPLLEWNGSVEFDFHIQLAEDLDSKILDIDTIVSNNASFQVSELKPNTSYNWRVKSVSGESNSEWSEIFTFNTKQSGYFLSPPILLSPQNNSEVDLPLTLVWNRGEDVRKYRIQLSKNSNFNQIIVDENSDFLNFKIEELEVNTNYYWRVRAISMYDSSEWSETFSFRVDENVKAVTLLTPINEELQVPRNSQLMWRPIIGVSYYDVQVAIDEKFKSKLVDDAVYSNSYNFTGLDFNTQYYWRIRFYKDGVASDWSDTWVFRTVTTRVLATPVITVPKENEAKIPIKGMVTWEAVEDADSYMISISTLDDKNTFIYKLNKVSKTVLEYDDLDYETSYLIKIAALNDTASSLWSVPFMFITELKPPKIVSPIDKSKNLSKEGTIEWKINGSLYQFRIQISNDRDFDDIVIDKKGIKGLTYNYNLNKDENYFVRVKAYNEYNESAWSDFVRFNTDSLGTSVDIISESTPNIYPNPTSDYIIIDYDGIIQGEIKLYDINGNIKQKEIIHSGENKIRLNSLSTGTYFIELNGKIYKIMVKN